MLINADCFEALKDIESNSIEAVVTDPPYGLKFMAKKWDDIGEGRKQREWHRIWLTESFRILKPNGIIIVCSGSRTFHHLIAMMEEVGFEDLRVKAWTYGSGFPKSHNLSKALDKAFGASLDNQDQKKMTAPTPSEAKTWEGWGTALKPAWESVCIGVKK